MSNPIQQQLMQTPEVLNRWRESYKGNDFPVEFFYSKDFGRRLRSSRFIESGEMVLFDKALSTVINCHEAMNNCDYCLNSISFTSSMFQPHCNKCQQVWYCCDTCQKEAASQHEIECSLFKCFGSCDLSDSSNTNKTVLKLLLRIVSHQIAEKCKGEKDCCSYPRFEDMSILLSNREHFSKEDLNQISYFWRKADEIMKSDSKSQYDWNKWWPKEKEFTEMACQIYCNCIGFRYNPCGRGLWIASSFLNHSCNPNLMLLDSGGSQIKYVATDNIKPGTDLTISYVNITSYQERRSKLSRCYYFDCSCDLCSQEAAHPTTTETKTAPMSS
jgi:hypothetical protein